MKAYFDPTSVMSHKKDEVNWEKEIALATIQSQTLDRQLLTLARESAEYQRRIKEAEIKLRESQAARDAERADRYDILLEMQRQFKQMQTELQKDVAEREKSIEAIRI